MKRFARAALALLMVDEGVVEGWWYTFRHYPSRLRLGTFEFDRDYLEARRDAEAILKKLAFIEAEVGQEAVEGMLELAYQRAFKRKESRELEAAGQGRMF